jgi:hypothetical protein
MNKIAKAGLGLVIAGAIIAGALFITSDEICGGDDIKLSQKIEINYKKLVNQLNKDNDGCESFKRSLTYTEEFCVIQTVTCVK